MQDVLPEGGVIRKLWVGEAAKYRDHMLRLDPDSRNSRFAGGVSDDFIRKYAALSQSLAAARLPCSAWIIESGGSRAGLNSGVKSEAFKLPRSWTSGRPSA